MLDAQGSTDVRRVRAPRLAVLLLAVAGAVAGVGPAADASAVPRQVASALQSDGWGTFFTNSGNGKFIKNSFSIESPTVQRGIQNISNTAIGGRNPTQAAFCKRKFRHCRIVQRIVDDP